MAIATVIIPCGVKHLPLLPRAIRSAYAQTIPVNVKWYIDRDKGTPAYGRNLLANQADTPFIIMLDADDYLLPDFTENLLKSWIPGSYVYSDWYQGEEYTRAAWCYGFRPLPGEATFHLPPTLFPTAYYKRLGGQDESLFGAEDTEFFFKANASRIKSIRVNKALFHYTPDGYRSREATRSPKWQDLLKLVFGRYFKDMSMGCCGDPAKPTIQAGQKQEGDILARPKWRAVQRTHGAVSHRYYGRISSYNEVWIDPRDFTEKNWTRVEDWESLAPTTPEIQKALADSDPLVAEIARAGIRISWEPTVITSGLDIQQNPYELAALIHAFEENGVKTVLEIGTGSSGGLGRFLTQKGYTVTSIDVRVPDPLPTWEFIEGDSLEVDVTGREFDAVIIDGDHTDKYVRGDYAKFEPLATRIVAIHDIDPEGYYPDVANFWKEIALTKAGNLRKGFYQSSAPGSKMGMGWHVKSTGGD